MKKSLLILSLLTAITASATPLSPDEALVRAREFENNGKRGAKAMDYPTLSYSLQIDNQPTIYVYTGLDGGFLVASADDMAPPILGYSATGVFDSSNLPPQMKWWLEGYSEQIAGLRSQGDGRKYSKRHAVYDNWAPIEPLVKTQWDQEYPYNLQCPLVGNRRCVTGCVATSMAQVMKYWEYPQKGTGSVSFYLDNIGELYLDFSEEEFQWSKMLNTYRGNSSTASRNAVAYLMKACGYGVKMDYDTGSSGVRTTYISNALRNYFKYDSGVGEKKRSDYSDDAWATLVYEQLTNIGPVIYNGVATYGGHSFVCDGYDKGGYFHINWGWGGLSDGYYLLDALNPSQQGAGGSEGGFNYNQTIISGIQPPQGRLIVNDMTITNCTSDSGNVPGQGYTYRIDNPHAINLQVDLKVAGGYLSSPIYVKIADKSAPSVALLETSFDQRLMLGDGNSAVYTQAFDFKQFDPAKVYILTISYMLNNKQTTIGSLNFAASSGVETIGDDTQDMTINLTGGILKLSAPAGFATAGLFDLSGLPVWLYEGSEREMEISMESLAKGVYVVSLTDKKGNTLRKKIVNM